MTTSNIIEKLNTCTDDQSRGLIAISSKTHFKQISFDNLSHICGMIQDPSWRILILEQYQHILNADVTPQSLNSLLLTFAPEFHDRIKSLLKDKHVSWFDEPSTPRYIPDDDIPDENIHLMTLDEYSHLESEKRNCSLFLGALFIIVIFMLFIY